MAINLIPEPNIQATNIPSGGAAQVQFDTSAFTVSPQANIFANFSKTISSAAQAMVNYNQLEENERKSQEAWQEQLKQIHGLTKTGQLSEEDYLKIQREANAKAQKDGIIRAHENWSTMTANSKDRAGIVANALEANLQTKWSSITNPDDDFATSIEGAEAEFFSPNQEGGYDVLGTDFNGNPVTADTSTMNPMELVALSQAVSAKRTAVEAAREEVRHQRTLEARQNAMSAGAYKSFDEFVVNRAQGAPDSGIIAEAMLVNALKGVANVAYDEGVEDINAVLLKAAEDFVKDIARKGIPNDPNFNAGLINRVINTVQSSLSIRNDEKGDPIMFAPRGSVNNRRLDDFRTTALSTLKTRLSSVGGEEDEKVAELNRWARLELSQFGGKPLTDEQVAVFSSKAFQKATGTGDGELALSLEGSYASLNKIDLMLAGMTYTAAAPKEKKSDGGVLANRGRGALTGTWATPTDYEAFLDEVEDNGNLTGADKRSIFSQAATRYASLQTEREGGGGSADTDKVFTRVNTLYTKRETVRDLIGEKVALWTDKPSPIENPFGRVTRGRVAGDVLDAISAEALQLLDLGEDGGTAPVTKLSDHFNPAQMKSLSTKVKAETLAAIEDGLKEEVTFKPRAEMTPSEARKYEAFLHKRIDHLSYLGAAISMDDTSYKDEDVSLGAELVGVPMQLTTAQRKATTRGRNTFLKYIAAPNL
tara:strand:- start:4359 stop:6479 length:2121 start_codon:yes stop_codon:yes gene_type:complete